jgi:hypothetical protein
LSGKRARVDAMITAAAVEIHVAVVIEIMEMEAEGTEYR